MRGIYKLMDVDTQLGVLNIDSGADIWEYEASAPITEQPLVFMLTMRDSGATRLSGDIIHNWVAGRAPEPNYEFINALMERVGITEYDPLAFFEYNKGRFITDSYYVEETRNG